MLVTVGLEVAGNIIFPEVLGGVISTVAGMLAMIWATNIATDVFGEDFGNMVGNFGARYFFGGHQANGGVGATYDMALGYYRETQTVLATQAGLDRATKSPFDITSKYTFLGSISSQLATYTPKSSSLLGIITSVGNVASTTKNPTLFLPTSALDEIEFRKTIGVNSSGELTCMQLATINAVGDQFCNPIRVHDLSTVESDPEDLFWKVAYICTTNGRGENSRNCSFEGSVKTVSYEEYRLAESRGDPFAKQKSNSDYEAYVFEENSFNNGLESVNPSSDLHKMIEYGVKRDSDLGILDVNIMQSITGGSKWIGYIPIIGDVVEAFNQLKSTSPSVQNWANGANICAGCTPEWDTTYKYLSQYIADTSIYEGMGAIEKSPVTAYIEQEILPNQDNSYEGRLAASMGMPKEYVVSTLAYMEDLRNSPRKVESLIASAPNIYATYYGGEYPNQLDVPKQDESCKIIDSMRECTQIAGTELRRRFNSEAVA